MTDHAADSRSGPMLYVAAVATLVACISALVYLASVLCTPLNLEPVRHIGMISLWGLIIGGPVAIGSSLALHCRACGKLLLPLVYNGKSLFAAKSPSAFTIIGAALSIVTQRHTPCPHCGVDARV